MMRVRGDHMSPHLQAQCRAAFVHRCTGEHIPAWAMRGNGSTPYRVQFKDDAEWLANTYFWVTVKGELAKRRACESHPTWNGPLIPYKDAMR